ncbi:MAG: DsbA family protein [Anaerolineae bacterium]|nr:DsbA family protein [Anaerolineae bacterium]
MQDRKVLTLLLLLLALVLVLAACGGDDNDDAESAADTADAAADDADDGDAGDAADDADDADVGDDTAVDDAGDADADADDADADADADDAAAADVGADDADATADDAGDAADTAADLDEGVQPFVWEDYGITVLLPEGWSIAEGGQEYDLSFVSPGAMAGGMGAYMTLKVYASLGTESLTEALQPVADETGTDLVTYDSGAVGVITADEVSGTEQRLLLFPYDAHGGALFVQASGTVAEGDVMAAILDSITIDPPVVDVDAANAAFQASLAADGTLTYGDADAPVVIREYYGFTCGHCANYMLPMHNVMALDVQTGRVRFEIAPMTGDPKSELATHAMYCAAEQGQGFSAYDALFRDYLDNGYEAAYTATAVNAIMESLDLDTDALNTCINDAAYTASLDTLREGFVALGLTGTPTITFALTGEDPVPLVVPTGAVWSGVVPLSAVRTVIALMVDQGLTPQEAANVMFGG